MLTHLDLFSGIGGFALAARWAGFQTVQFVEIDQFCQRVLQKNFPGVPVHDDIKTFNEPSTPFLLTGGFPCQPFSCAGKRRGKEDDRYLWPEMLRVVSEAKPAWVIGENVAGFINMGLDDCISDLENQGYEVQAFIIPACAVNAPHRRDRVWIVGNSDGGGRNKRTLGEVQGRESTESARIDGITSNPNQFNGNDAGHDASEVSQLKEAEIFRGEFNTDTGNQGLPESERPGSHGEGQAAHGSTAECLSAWNEPWLEAATRLCRVDDGVSNRVDRLKSLGNAIVPRVAYEIMKAITEVSR